MGNPLGPPEEIHLGAPAQLPDLENCPPAVRHGDGPRFRGKRQRVRTHPRLDLIRGRGLSRRVGCCGTDEKERCDRGNANCRANGGPPHDSSSSLRSCPTANATDAQELPTGNGAISDSTLQPAGESPVLASTASSSHRRTRIPGTRPHVSRRKRSSRDRRRRLLRAPDGCRSSHRQSGLCCHRQVECPEDTAPVAEVRRDDEVVDAADVAVAA